MKAPRNVRVAWVSRRRFALAIERLEDRLVPGETLGAMLLAPATMFPDFGPPAQDVALVGSPSRSDQGIVSTVTDEASDLAPLAAWEGLSSPMQQETSPAPMAGTAQGGSGLGDIGPTFTDQDGAARLTMLRGVGLSTPDAPQMNAGFAANSAPSGEAGGLTALPTALPAAGSGAALNAMVASLAAGSSAEGTSQPMISYKPMLGPGSGYYTPSQIRTAYGFDQLSQDGSGRTIGIVDAYDDPTALSDLNYFSNNFGLPQFNVSGGPTFSKVNETGGSSLPAKNAGWALEVSLDIEWAHAVAPKANILLVEATNNSNSNLFNAVGYAAKHAQVVSMSWGGGETNNEASAYDKYFSGASGVVFTVSAGDSGTGAEYPAASPYVVAVGGTSLPQNIDLSANTNAETSWNGSGGGISADEKMPTYQVGFPSSTLDTTKRGIPDVAYDADPNTGVAVYDTTTYQGYKGWWTVGGTSAGAPQWAALFALADQTRAANHLSMLSSSSLASSPAYTAAAGTHYATDYRDITTGNNYQGTGTPPAVTLAGTGYDFVTGLGVPQANNLVPYLAQL